MDKPGAYQATDEYVLLDPAYREQTSYGHEVAIGIFAGLAMVGLLFAQHYFGILTEYVAQARYYTIPIALIPMVTVIGLINRRAANRMFYKLTWELGLVTGMVGGGIVHSFSWIALMIYERLVFPEWVEVQLAFDIKEFQKQGESPESIQKFIEAATKYHNDPINQVTDYLNGLLIILIVSAIATYFQRWRSKLPEQPVKIKEAEGAPKIPGWHDAANERYGKEG